MLYTAVLGILSGIAFGRHFKATNVGAAALSAVVWAWALGSFAGHGFLYAAYEAIFLTWSLESGLLLGLLLNRLVFHRRGRTAVVSQMTALPDEAHPHGSI